MVLGIKLKTDTTYANKAIWQIRHLLKDGKAKVVNRRPFTIQISLYQTTTYTQTLEPKCRCRSKTIGLSVSS